MRIRILEICLAFAVASVFCGCGPDEIAPSPDGQVRVVGQMTPFAENHAATRSTKNQYETVVKNMALFVFDSAGAKVDYIYTDSGQPLFLIDRSKSPYSSHTQPLMSSCELFILANIPAADTAMLRGIDTRAKFMAADCTIPRVIRTSEISSYGGLPMWGSQGSVDLSEGSSTASSTVLTIPLTCMMSKLTFNIIVDPVQKSDFPQRFELKSWMVENAPGNVTVAQPSASDTSAHASGPFLAAATFGQVDNGVNPVMQGGSTPMTFCCYVPEHRVLPSNTSVSYPEGIDSASMQNYKPLYLAEGDRPLKVTLKGIYTDHRNLTKDVSYTIYPGADNWKDFFVERNHEYIHDIVIKGISNSKDEDVLSVSLDTRVDVQQNDFKFQLERETLLDSHWEIRPIRITLDKLAHPTADRIEVEIMETDGVRPSWIRFESPDASEIQASPASYCEAAEGSLSYGKRRYFTTNLVTETLSANTSVTINADDASNSGVPNEHVIWVYMDENAQYPSDPNVPNRSAQVQCRYFEKGQTVPTVTEDYYFLQKYLHKVTYDDRSYGIEYYEEYLYNFDAREQYGSTTDGMAWGLDGKQLSFEINAIAVDGVLSDDAATSRVRSVFPNAFYDYYNTSAEAGGGRLCYFPYKGHRFTRKINEKMAFAPLATNASPASAIEYCLNKNKRNSDGSIPEGFHWYLPAIDEIEDICMGGYSDFEVFQDKYYWSSQPAFMVDSLSYTLWYVVGQQTNYGNFYEDNVNYARATKVNYTGGTYKTVNSGAVGSETLYSFNYLSNDYGTNVTGKTTYYQDGYQPRIGKENRIRCVYGTYKNYTSSFGFETSTSEGIWTSTTFSRNTGTKRTGNASGSFSVSSGWTASTGSATVNTTQCQYAPGQLNFYVSYSGDAPTSSTWTVSVSTDKSNWTQVSSYTTLSTSFSQVSVDLSAYHDVYVRIQNSTRVPGALTGNTTNLFIDDIQFTYTD